MRTCRKCGERWMAKSSRCPKCDAPHIADVDRAVPRPDCLACQGRMKKRGVMPIRTHGAEKGWWNLSRRIEQLDERVWKLTVYRCEDCRRVELYEI